MARIEGIRIRNFRALRDVTLGKVLSMQEPDPLTPMTAVIGKNGAGKSTLFDAFGFLADCLRTGVEEAFDARGRGGFERVKSQGARGPIEFEVYYKEEGNARPITYELSIDSDSSGRPYVLKERLRQRRKGQKHGWPFSFLILNEGKGVVWRGETEGRQINEGQEQLDLLHLMETINKEESREIAELLFFSGRDPCTINWRKDFYNSEVNLECTFPRLDWPQIGASSNSLWADLA
jgi:predicted ATPase